jgi:hypothetical protein
VRHYLRARPDIEVALRPDVPADRLRRDLPAETRIHVIYRDAAYAAPTLDALRAELTLVSAGPDRFRVAYLVFRTP